jgi:hypothetical protein
VLVSTAPFHKGALNFALTHGIALVAVTEGRFTYETKAASPPPELPRRQAGVLGIPTFIGHAYSRGDTPGSVGGTVASPEYPEYLAERLLP